MFMIGGFFMFKNIKNTSFTLTQTANAVEMGHYNFKTINDQDLPLDLNKDLLKIESLASNKDDMVTTHKCPKPKIIYKTKVKYIKQKKDEPEFHSFSIHIPHDVNETDTI